MKDDTTESSDGMKNEEIWNTLFVLRDEVALLKLRARALENEAEASKQECEYLQQQISDLRELVLTRCEFKPPTKS